MDQLDFLTEHTDAPPPLPGTHLPPEARPLWDPLAEETPPMNIEHCDFTALTPAERQRYIATVSEMVRSVFERALLGDDEILDRYAKPTHNNRHPQQKPYHPGQRAVQVAEEYIHRALPFLPQNVQKLLSSRPGLWLQQLSADA